MTFYSLLSIVSLSYDCSKGFRIPVLLLISVFVEDSMSSSNESDR